MGRRNEKSTNDYSWDFLKKLRTGAFFIPANEVCWIPPSNEGAERFKAIYNKEKTLGIFSTIKISTWPIFMGHQMIKHKDILFYSLQSLKYLLGNPVRTSTRSNCVIHYSCINFATHAQFSANTTEGVWDPTSIVATKCGLFTEPKITLKNSSKAAKQKR